MKAKTQLVRFMCDFQAPVPNAGKYLIKLEPHNVALSPLFDKKLNKPACSVFYIHTAIPFQSTQFTPLSNFQ